jgi:glycine cleavage system H protein
MSFEYPQDLRYLDTHEYVRLDGDIATIGISEFAIDQLGDIVFLELSDIGDAISTGDTFGTIESVKAVESLKSPISGTVIERNDALINDPEGIGDDTYGEGWFIKMRVNDTAEIEEAMTADEYRALVDGE